MANGLQPQGPSFTNILRAFAASISPAEAQRQDALAEERRKRAELPRLRQQKVNEGLLRALTSGQIKDSGDQQKIINHLRGFGFDVPSIGLGERQGLSLSEKANLGKNFTTESVERFSTSGDTSDLERVTQETEFSPANITTLLDDHTAPSVQRFIDSGFKDTGLLQRRTKEDKGAKFVNLSKGANVVTVQEGTQRFLDLIGEGYVLSGNQSLSGGETVTTTAPDGTVMTITRGGRSGVSPAIERKTKAMLEAEVINAENGLANLARTKDTFRREWQELPRRWFIAGLEGLDKLGVKLSPRNRQMVADYNVFAQNAVMQLNRTIKAITGAAMSIQEAERISNEVPNLTKDGPIAFEAKMDNLINILDAAQLRAMNRLHNGISPNIQETDPNYESTDSFNLRVREAMAEAAFDIQRDNPGISRDEMRRLVIERVTEDMFGRYAETATRQLGVQ